MAFCTRSFHNTLAALKPGAAFVLNVSDAGKQKIAQDVARLAELAGAVVEAQTAIDIGCGSAGNMNTASQHTRGHDGPASAALACANTLGSSTGLAYCRSSGCRATFSVEREGHNSRALIVYVQVVDGDVSLKHRSQICTIAHGRAETLTQM